MRETTWPACAISVEPWPATPGLLLRFCHADQKVDSVAESPLSPGSLSEASIVDIVDEATFQYPIPDEAARTRLSRIESPRRSMPVICTPWPMLRPVRKMLWVVEEP